MSDRQTSPKSLTPSFTPVQNRSSPFSNTAECSKSAAQKKKDRKRDRLASVRSEPPAEKRQPAPINDENAEERKDTLLVACASPSFYRWKEHRSRLDWSAIAKGNGCQWTLDQYRAGLAQLYKDRKEEQYKELFKSYNSYLDPEMLCLYHLPGSNDRWGGLAIAFLTKRIDEIKRSRKGEEKIEGDGVIVSDRNRRRPTELIILTGRGKRNQGKKAVIKETVEAFLTEMKYDWENDNDGQITVHFSKIGRGTFERLTQFCYLF